MHRDGITGLVLGPAAYPTRRDVTRRDGAARCIRVGHTAASRKFDAEANPEARGKGRRWCAPLSSASSSSSSSSASPEILRARTSQLARAGARVPRACALRFFFETFRCIFGLESGGLSRKWERSRAPGL